MLKGPPYTHRSIPLSLKVWVLRLWKVYTHFRYIYLSLTRCQPLIKSCQSQADNEVGKSIQILNCITNFKRVNLQHISIFCWESLSLFTNLSGNRFEFKSLPSSNNDSRGVHKKQGSFVYGRPDQHAIIICRNILLKAFGRDLKVIIFTHMSLWPSLYFWW